MHWRVPVPHLEPFGAINPREGQVQPSAPSIRARATSNQTHRAQILILESSNLTELVGRSFAFSAAPKEGAHDDNCHARQVGVRIFNVLVYLVNS